VRFPEVVLKFLKSPRDEKITWRRLNGTIWWQVPIQQWVRRTVQCLFVNNGESGPGTLHDPRTIMSSTWWQQRIWSFQSV